MFLHPTQRAAVERSYKGPALVSGSAGTGKTVVALHRAAHPLRAGGRIPLTTYSRTLAARLAQSAGLLLGEEAKGLRIEPLLRVARELLQQLGKRGVHSGERAAAAGDDGVRGAGDREGAGAGGAAAGGVGGDRGSAGAG